MKLSMPLCRPPASRGLGRSVCCACAEETPRLVAPAINVVNSNRLRRSGDNAGSDDMAFSKRGFRQQRRSLGPVPLPRPRHHELQHTVNRSAPARLTVRTRAGGRLTGGDPCRCRRITCADGFVLTYDAALIATRMKQGQRLVVMGGEACPGEGQEPTIHTFVC